MSINAADIMRQLHETAAAVKDGKLDAESALAIASVADKQIGVMKTVLDYMRLSGNATLLDKGGDVFIGTEALKQLNGPAR